MTGESFFIAMAGLGVSLAGFAGLITALDRRPAAHTAVSAWRIRNIVIGGFTVMFEGLATVALYQVTDGNLDLTIRLASLLVAAVIVPRVIIGSRPGPEWPTKRGRYVAIAFAVGLLLASLANVFVAGLGYLEAILLFQLSGPASIFINTVREVASGD